MIVVSIVRAVGVKALQGKTTRNTAKIFYRPLKKLVENTTVKAVAIAPLKEPK